MHLVADWAEREFDEVRPGVVASTISSDELTVTLYRYAAGSSWEEHVHPEDQITTVLEGAIDFTVDGQPTRLSAGQLVLLPGGTTHAATVPPSGAVTLNVWRRRG